MATLADLVKRQRRAGTSASGALFTAVGQKTLAAIDPRKMFNQKGLLTALFPSLRAYKPDSPRSKVDTASTELSGSTAPLLEQMVMKLDGLDLTMRLVAKNTMAMPGMSRDMNIMRQNIIKLVTLQGGKASTRADAFFLRAFERERATEAQLQAAKDKREASKVSETKPKKEKTGFSLTSIISTITAPFLLLSEKLNKFFEGVMTNVGKFFDVRNLSSIFSVMLEGLAKGLGKFGTLLRFASKGIANPGFFAIAALGGLAYGLYKLIESDKGEGSGETPGPSTPEERQPANIGASELRSSADEEIRRARENMRNSEDPAVRKAAEELDRTNPLPEIKRSPTPAGSVPSNSPMPMMNKSKELLDIIAKGESGAAGYEAMNQGGNKQTGIIGSGSSEKIIGKKLTDMTVSEILRRGKLPFGDKERIFAAGRYQIIPDTLQGLVNQGVVKPEDKFNEDTQDRLGRALIEQSGALKSATEGNMVEAQNRLAKVWGAIPSATTGQTALGGPNKADARLGQMIQASLSGQAITTASVASADNRMQLAAAPSNIVVNAPNVSSGSGKQKQTAQLPNTIDTELFNALFDRATMV